MYNKRNTNKNIKNIGIVIIATLIGFALTGIVLFIFSFLITKIDAPSDIKKLLSVVALGIGSCVGGYYCSKRKKRHGIFCGAICGFVMFVLIVIFGAIFADTILSFKSTTKLLLVLICGGIGGVVGVNSKSKFFKRWQFIDIVLSLWYNYKKKKLGGFHYETH